MGSLNEELIRSVCVGGVRLRGWMVREVSDRQADGVGAQTTSQTRASSGRRRAWVGRGAREGRGQKQPDCLGVLRDNLAAGAW